MKIVKDFWAEPSYAQLLLAMQKRVHDYVVAGKGTAKAALDALVKDWTEVFKEDGKIKLSSQVAPGNPAVSVRDRRPRSRTVHPSNRRSSTSSQACRERRRPTPRRCLAARACPTGRWPGSSSAPRSLLLLAFNIFPLLWTIWLSFTNYRANRPERGEVLYVGHRQLPARTDRRRRSGRPCGPPRISCCWSIALQLLLGFALALLINRRFRSHSFWTTVILLPMMLAPAVVGTFWTFLLSAAVRDVQQHVAFLTGIDPRSFQMIGDVRLAPWAIVWSIPGCGRPMSC